jgi:hypothetical protein
MKQIWKEIWEGIRKFHFSKTYLFCLATYALVFNDEVFSSMWHLLIYLPLWSFLLWGWGIFFVFIYHYERADLIEKG